MGKSALKPVAEAVFALLEADVLVTAKIRNAVPDENQAYAYLLMGRFEEEKNDTFERSGKFVFWEIDAVSEHLGDLKAMELLEPAIEALDREPLVVSGFSNGFNVRHILTEPSTVFSSTQLLRSISARFEIFVQQD